MKRSYRRKYLVDIGYQFAQAGLVIAANLLVALLMAALLSWFYLLEWDGSIAVDHNRRIPVYILTFMFVVMLGTTLLSLRRSRMIAGMFLKLNKVLSDAAEGILPEREISFRRSDYFGQLADPLNRCLRRLGQSDGGQSDGREQTALLGALGEILDAARARGTRDPDLLLELEALLVRCATRPTADPGRTDPAREATRLSSQPGQV